MEAFLESDREFYTTFKKSKISGNLTVSHNSLFFPRKDQSFLLPVLFPTLVSVCVFASTWRIFLCSNLWYRPKITIEDKVISVVNWKLNLLEMWIVCEWEMSYC